MATDERSAPQKENGLIQFNLLGLMVFILSLVVASSVLTYALGRSLSKPDSPVPGQTNGSDFTNEKAPNPVPPWGELIAYDTQMERPEEYTALEATRQQKATWIFAERQPSQVRSLLAACQLTPQQIERALAFSILSAGTNETTLCPDEQLILSLTPEVRNRLYGELAKNEANHYMRFPFCFPGNSFDEIVSGAHLPDETVSYIRSLLYRRGDADCLSDFELVMQHATSEENRLRVIKALSSQSAVLARIRIRSTTDIQKLLDYWAWSPGVRLTNLRPLLESLKRLEGGGTISLLYFLPQFARERLYTYPLPSQPGDPAMDCHWSTMNFFNETPDNRFADPNYTVPYLNAHYYPVARPMRYGDLVFLLNDKGDAIHSAVYLADDIVFTKNGNNYMEPWMLMRMKNLIATYSVDGPPRILVYRSKSL